MLDDSRLSSRTRLLFRAVRGQTERSGEAGNYTGIRICNLQLDILILYLLSVYMLCSDILIDFLKIRI